MTKHLGFSYIFLDLRAKLILHNVKFLISTSIRDFSQPLKCQTTGVLHLQVCIDFTFHMHDYPFTIRICHNKYCFEPHRRQSLSFNLMREKNKGTLLSPHYLCVDNLMMILNAGWNSAKITDSGSFSLHKNSGFISPLLSGCRVILSVSQWTRGQGSLARWSHWNVNIN